MVELSRNGCPATFDAVLTEFKCGPMAFPGPFLTECGSRRVVTSSYIDVGMTCVYDAAGALVGSRSCSKTVGNCNCFVGGDVPADLCEGKPAVDLCDADAGT